MYNGGEIIIVRNIVFDGHRADHASLGGRPCVILSDVNDKITMLPLTSSKSPNNSGFNVEFTKNQIKCDNPQFRKKDKTYVNLLSIFQREIRFYDVDAHVTDKRYYRFLEEIFEKRLEYERKCREIYREIYPDLEKQRDELRIILKR